MTQSDSRSPLAGDSPPLDPADSSASRPQAGSYEPSARIRRFDWLSEFLARLEDEHIVAHRGDARILAPAHRLVLDPEDWAAAAKLAAGMGMRHAGLWSDPLETEVSEAEIEEPCLRVRACLEQAGDYLVIETDVPLNRPLLGSQTPAYPGLDRLERHAHDLTGVVFTGHPFDSAQDRPDERRWTRHQAWPADRFPLRHDFPLSGETTRRTPADADYPFVRVQGAGVYEIPVGPVHAGIIEPGHFRFHAMGEEVLRLEQRLGYVHKGIEKLAVGRDPAGLVRLAGRVSGDSTVAHAWAACQAIERATGCAVPPRALTLRAVMAERERIANHLGDIGAICNDVGFAFAHVQCARLREQWQRRSRALFGHRFMMDALIPGGVVHDLSADAFLVLRQDHAALHRTIEPLFDVIDDHPSLDDRLIATGILSQTDARALGCTGYVGKASGLRFDVRRDNPYPPYDSVRVEESAETEGDVAARVRVRMAEVRSSLWMLDRLLDALPEGEIVAPLPAVQPDAVGLGLIDGWRGEILCFVRFDAEGRIARYFPRDPSWFTWPALERLILGNIVPDFPVCNKSVNGSYAGQDL
ncbi:NADH-quinone oxidoreductase subunit C [Thiocystis violascens]|uniref:Ni,Fe-hydrogenase III large subunit n=1 Tax=Thiocystis violascens (strain ATCC 17096 / DSM 198 / 6111) TaxID=765911 RepID=I3YCU6_THIV6|nr:Ni,Fe-hydrogenase III large subunit [Thiocystis violascens DSM 198]